MGEDGVPCQARLLVETRDRLMGRKKAYKTEVLRGVLFFILAISFLADAVGYLVQSRVEC